MVTSEQVAQLAGVSRATVSRALNGSARVSSEAKERVYAAIEALGYEPDTVAQSLVRQRSQAIAVSIYAEDNEAPLSHFGRTGQYFHLIVESVEREIVSLGYDMLLPSRPNGKSPENYVRSLQTRRIAGFIVLHGAASRIHALIRSSIPTVFIDKTGQGSHATYVKSDNMDGARQATRHLLSLGHRCIALLTGLTSDLSGLERLLGCQEVLAQAGIAPDPGLVRQSGWELHEAYEAAMLLLAERRDFTAIVAGSDIMAIGILRALTEHGLHVPADISLIGFDDITLCEYTTPQLTTVRQDREALGRGAVQRLIDLIDGTEEVSPLILPTQLVVRKSTGPAPS